jgi:hypothetical protein
MATTRKREPQWPVSVGVYGVLFLFGAVQGLIGSFQYSRAAGSVPVAALVSCAVILATCVLGAWATRSVSGAVLPGIGWILHVVRTIHAGLQWQRHHHQHHAGQVVPVRRHAQRGRRGGRVVRRRDPLAGRR